MPGAFRHFRFGYGVLFPDGKAQALLSGLYVAIPTAPLGLWDAFALPYILEAYMKKRILLVFTHLLVAILAVTITLNVRKVQEVKAQTKLEQMQRIIQEKFIGDVDEKKMEDAMASAMVNSLGDRWSYYLPAEELQSHKEQMSNAYVGIGVTIVLRADESGFDVKEVAAGSPAEEAGIQPGDILTHVAGQRVSEIGLTATKDLLRGKEGTVVSLTVSRQGNSQQMSVTLREIVTPVAIGTLLPDGIGLIRIENFDSRCASESIAAIESLREQGARALIFDVRFNPGGYKHELVKLLDYLLPEGVLFRSEDYTGKVSVDTSDAACLQMPMAVLVNGDSYSAAEFFAAALSEYEAAVVVGQQTCGKGYFQNLFELNDGSAIGLSVGKYTTPKGVSLAGVGITPDIVVAVDDAVAEQIRYQQLAPAEDPQIQAAVEALK